MEAMELLSGALMAVAEVTTDVGGELGVPGVPESSRGEPGEGRGSTRSSSPSGVGSLFSSSRRIL